MTSATREVYPVRHWYAQAIGMMPAATIVLVIAALGALLWFMDRSEREEQRASLINDALWVEQALHFAVQSDADDIARLASDIRQGLTPAAARPHLELMLRNSPEIVGIVWYDGNNAIVAAVPGMAPDAAAKATLSTRQIALQAGQTSYSQAVPNGSGYGFELAVPLYYGLRPAGVLAASFSLDGLLNNHIPWWVAQKYQVAFADTGGAVLARRTSVVPDAQAASHAIAFDPPGAGLTLSVTRFDSRTSLAANALVATIVAFSLLAIASLVVTRRHMIRRGAAELALQEEHALRKAMEESLTVGMRARDHGGKIIYVNQAFCRMVGWPAEELVGCAPPMPYWIPEDMERTLELHQLVLDGRAPPEGFEIKFRRRNGERFDALIYEAPLIDADGRQRGWMGSVLDITERKHIEDLSRQQTEKLSQTARLVTMGEMASTLAHELNQPLTAISSYATGSIKWLEQGLVDRAELLAVFAKLSAQAQRAGQIIRRVREFVRKSEPNFAAVNVEDLVSGTLEFVAPELRAQSIAVGRQPQGQVPLCTGDRILLEQVLLNLIRNAIEAMAQTPKRSRKLSIAHRLGNGEVTTLITDRGPGLSAHMREKLFVPFATTKSEGMGMGLNICRTIVEMHRGRLWFEDRPGGGSVFAFTIPVHGE
jgi:two-component system, LuxR family, sensor histidine kinase DctS